MSYTLDRILSDDFATAEARTRKALGENGFGVLTEIDVQATMKAKLGHTMPAYKILGACNPAMAWQAFAHEPKVGSMLPCNVILRQTDAGVEVSAVDPVASMQAIPNPDLAQVAGEVREALKKVVASI